MRPERRGAEMIRFAGGHHPNAVFVREPYSVIAAGGGNMLADGTFAVERQTGTTFGGNAAGRGDLDIATLPLGQIVGEQADAVRVHAAEIRGNQGFGNKVAGSGGGSGGGGKLTAERTQVCGLNKGHNLRYSVRGQEDTRLI